MVEVDEGGVAYDAGIGAEQTEREDEEEQDYQGSQDDGGKGRDKCETTQLNVTSQQIG